MGKKSKKIPIMEATIEDTSEILAKGDEKLKRKSSGEVIESTDKVEPDSHKSKRNKTPNVLHDTIDEKVANNLDTQLKGKKSKRNKTLKISEELSHHHKKGKTNVSAVTGLTHTSKKKDMKEVQTANNDKPKKIVFVDDQPQEVSPDTSANNQREKKKYKQSLNEEDAAVKDEEIDKFCDELSEHDNEQYESWVKLIEAKLHSNNT